MKEYKNKNRAEAAQTFQNLWKAASLQEIEIALGKLLQQIDLHEERCARLDGMKARQLTASCIESRTFRTLARLLVEQCDSGADIHFREPSADEKGSEVVQVVEIQLRRPALTQSRLAAVHRARKSELI